MFTGRQIQDARQRLGLTQEELAKAIDVSPPYVSLLESGKRRPSTKVTSALARVLQLDEAEVRTAMHDVRLGELPSTSSRAVMAAYAATSVPTGEEATSAGAASRLERLITSFAHLSVRDQETVLALTDHLESKTTEPLSEWVLAWRRQLDAALEEESE